MPYVVRYVMANVPSWSFRVKTFRFVGVLVYLKRMTTASFNILKQQYHRHLNRNAIFINRCTKKCDKALQENHGFPIRFHLQDQEHICSWSVQVIKSSCSGRVPSSNRVHGTRSSVERVSDPFSRNLTGRLSLNYLKWERVNAFFVVMYSYWDREVETYSFQTRAWTGLCRQDNQAKYFWQCYLYPPAMYLILSMNHSVCLLYIACRLSGCLKTIISACMGPLFPRGLRFSAVDCGPTGRRFESALTSIEWSKALVCPAVSVRLIPCHLRHLSLWSLSS